MAINVPIITEFIDKGLKDAQGAFNIFKTKVGEADGAMGKFKAGGTAALDAVKANAGMFAAAAGSAIAGFALKAISDFQDLALEVDKFSNSTGLAAEEASRWIEVSGDLGVESRTLLTAVNKLNKAVGENSGAFAELGAEIVRTSSGATDVNATFLNTIEALRKIDDPAQRARLATQTLGKSWTELSELVEMGATDLTAALEGVSDAKVINEDEIRKAKELRAAQDALNDAIEDFTLTVGSKLIPAFTKIVGAATPVLGFFADFQKSFDFWDVTAVGIIENVASSMSDWFGDPGLADMVDRLQQLEDQTNNTIDMTDDLAIAWKDGYRAMADARRAAEGLDDALVSVDDTLAELKGNIDERQAWRNLIDTIEDAGEAALEAFAEKTPESLRRSQAALDDARLEVAEYIAKIDSIPEDKRTEFIAALDKANLDQVKKILDDAAYTRTVAYLPTVGGRPVMPGDTPSESSRRPAQPRPIRTPRPGSAGPRSVIVNVSGSVISERDLVETVRKGLVNSQRNGNQLVYNNQ